jgi:hypothetical protein
MITLNNFIKRFGTNTTSNFDLINFASDLGIKNFRVIMSNELKKLKSIKKLPIYIIINYQSSNEGDGTHWCAIYKDYNNSYYFDSFGIQPLEFLLKILIAQIRNIVMII